jgi:hypothetical protein
MHNSEIEAFAADPSDDIALVDTLRSLQDDAADVLGTLSTLRKHGGDSAADAIPEAVIVALDQLQHDLGEIASAVDQRRR